MTALPALEEGEIMKNTTDFIFNMILFILFTFLLFGIGVSIDSLDERIEKLESYHSNICSECGQVLHN